VKADVIVTEANFYTSLWVARSLAKKGLKVLGLANAKGAPLYSRYYKKIIIEESFIELLVDGIIEGRLVFPHLEKTYLSLYKKNFQGSVCAPPKDMAFWIVDKKIVIEKLISQFSEIMPKTYIISYTDDTDSIINTIIDFQRGNKKIIIKTTSEIDTTYGPNNRYILLENEIKDEGEFMNVVNFIKKHNVVIMQEYVNGIGIGIGGLWLEGKPVIIGGHKRLKMSHRSGGVSTIAESHINQRGMHKALDIMEHIRYTGIALVEFKYDPTNDKIYFMEINPRIWGTLPLYIMAGADIPWAAYKLFVYGDYKNSYFFKEGVKIKFFFNNILATLMDPQLTYWRKLLMLFNDLNIFDSKEALFSYDDPVPFIIETFSFIKKGLRYLIRSGAYV